MTDKNRIDEAIRLARERRTMASGVIHDVTCYMDHPWCLVLLLAQQRDEARAELAARENCIANLHQQLMLASRELAEARAGLATLRELEREWRDTALIDGSGGLMTARREAIYECASRLAALIAAAEGER